MPYKYAVECICDKLAATKTYAGGHYTPDMPLIHWNKYGSKALGNPKTLAFINEVFIDLSKHGDSYVLNKAYMKKKYAEICGTGEIPKAEGEIPLYEVKDTKE